MNAPNTVCTCAHWTEEHEDGGECAAPSCPCSQFVFDPVANTPGAIADRGGEHAAGCTCALCVWQHGINHPNENTAADLAAVRCERTKGKVG